MINVVILFVLSFYVAKKKKRRERRIIFCYQHARVNIVELYYHTLAILSHYFFAMIL
jgi:predicted PurR-regulated permease PerM